MQNDSHTNEDGWTFYFNQCKAPEHLNKRDELILHALGVAWEEPKHDEHS
jgi:hypothetical protein